MYLNNQRKIAVKINQISLENGKSYDEIEVVYNFQREIQKVSQEFTFVIESLHSLLFSSIEILIKNKGKIFAGSKIGIKTLESRTYQNVLFAPKDLFSADFYNKKSQELGKITFSVVISSLEQPFYEPKQNIANNFIRTVFDRFLNDFAARIFNLTFAIQDGSLRCKIKAITGFMTTQVYSKLLFHPCSGEHLENVCNDPNCFEKYAKIESKQAKIGLKGLHYAVIAYSHVPFPLFGPKKLRQVECDDPVRKHILEHALISEGDIVKVHQGGMQSVTFISFFDKNSLVITFRGTYSVNELFNVLDARYVPFWDGFAHSGFLRLASDFLNKELGSILKTMHKRQCRSLVLAGHSLGGAIATMVYLCLKTDPKHKKSCKKIKVQVLSYSSPPTVSKNIASKSLPDILGFNYEDDVIPQLSFGSILDFKFLCISIQAKWLLHSLMFRKKKEFLAETNDIRKYLKEANIHEKLYAPGKIYHIRGVKLQNTTVYKFKLSDLSYFGEIKYNINSLFCHFLFKIADALSFSIFDKKNDKI